MNKVKGKESIDEITEGRGNYLMKWGKMETIDKRNKGRGIYR